MNKFYSLKEKGKQIMLALAFLLVGVNSTYAQDVLTPAYGGSTINGDGYQYGSNLTKGNAYVIPFDMSLITVSSIGDVSYQIEVEKINSSPENAHLYFINDNADNKVATGAHYTAPSTLVQADFILKDVANGATPSISASAELKTFLTSALAQYKADASKQWAFLKLVMDNPEPAAAYDVIYLVVGSSKLTVTQGAVSNTPPVLTAIGNIAATEGTSKAVALSATDAEDDNATLTFSVAATNGSDDITGITVNGSNLEIAATTAANTYNVTVTVTDSGSLTDTEDIVITVSAASSNNAPTLFNPAFQGETSNTLSIDVSGTGTLKLKALAFDADVTTTTHPNPNANPGPVTFSKENDDNNLVTLIEYDGGPWAAGAPLTNVITAFYTIDASSLTNGTYTFDLVVTDEHGATGTETITVEVTGAVAGNHAPEFATPVFNKEADNTIELDKLSNNSVRLQAWAKDIDVTSDEFGNGEKPDAVIFSVENDTEGLVTLLEKDGGPWAVPAYDNALFTAFYTIEATGILAGTYTFDAVATDEHGTTAKETITVIITGTTVGDPAEYTYVPHAVESITGVASEYAIGAFDFDADDIISFSLQAGAPDFVTVVTGDLADNGDAQGTIKISSACTAVKTEITVLAFDGNNYTKAKMILEVRDFVDHVIASREDRGIMAKESDGTFKEWYAGGEGDYKGADFFAGLVGGAGSMDAVQYIIPIQIPSTNNIESASLKVTMFKTGALKASLYGIGFRTSAMVEEDDVNAGTKIVTNFYNSTDHGTVVVPGEVSVSSDDAAIATFIEDQIKAGAKVGDYVFFRISPNSFTMWDYMKFYSADGIYATEGGYTGVGAVPDALKPQLSIVFGDDNLSTENELMSEFRVYPNPSNGGAFSIALPESTQDISVQIFSVNGRMISSDIAKGNVFTSSLNLNAGVYIVKISNSEFELSKKLMVK